jgi:ribosomal protein S18 acetylase RimI-like enzyme
LILKGAAMPADLTFRRYDAEGARAISETVELIHHEAYAAAIERGDPFESGDAPMKRFDLYTRRGEFDLVVASLDGEPVGQAWGWALQPDSAWWKGLVGEVGPGFTDEDGKRTFAFSEFMVRARYAGQGIGRALHDELLAPRNEERASLLVRPENATAYRRYTRWGWRKAAELRPAVPNAPLMDVLILPLPLQR